jgi:hypothetical protein
MSRRPVGVLAAGAIVSALFATSPRLGANNEARGQVRTGAQQESAGAMPKLTLKLETPEQFKAQALTDYLEQLKKRFQDACVQGSTIWTDGTPEAPAASPTSPSGRQPAGTAVPFGETIHRLCGPERKDFLIALVPDPVHTRLALDFDRLIEVIQEAAQDGDFQFVAANLPWDTRAHPESDDIAVRLNNNAYIAARQSLPGLLTFRKPRSHEHLFVWLVGESPTGGIAKDQFSQAMDWIAHAVPEQTNPPTPLRILGPTFSGSLSSLASLLTSDKGALDATTPFLALSGSISNRSSIETFLNWEKGRPIRFASFQETDDVLIERFKEYVAGHAYGAGEFHEDSIAILSEDETEYGGIVAASLSNQGCRHCSYLHFPREISRLRAAYQGIDARNGEVQGGPYTILPLNLEISGADDDTVAPYSKQSPLSQEGVLLGIVSELRKHAVQFIILRATDPIDVLFLSRYLGAAYPKARIVTLGADVLFSREIEDKQLHGILALSTYSLASSANHEFLSHGQSERVFPSSTEAGAYNALRALLARPQVDFSADPLDRVKLGAADLHLYQYGWLEPLRNSLSGLDSNTPPAHLLALGRDGYWPVAHLGPFPGEKNGTLLPKVSTDQVRSCAQLEVVVPISWIAAELIALLLAAAFVLALWFASIRSQSQFAASLSPATMDATGLLVAGSGLVLTAILLLLLVPLLGGGDWVIPWRGPLSAILILCLVMVLAATLCDLSSRLNLAAAKALPTFGWILCLVVLVAWWIVGRRQVELLPTGAWRFVVLRSLQTTSGLSPILPLILLLAGWLWWAFQISSGITLLHHRRPQLPKDVSDEKVLFVAESAAEPTEAAEPTKGRATYLVTELIETLRPSRKSAWLYTRRYAAPGAVAATCLLGLAAFSPRTPWPLMTLDAADFQAPLMALLWLAATGIVGTTLCLWDIWLKARRLLVMLDSVPLRRGFKALEGFSWQPLWRVGLASLAELQRIIAREREALEVASNMDEKLRSAQEKVEYARNNVRKEYWAILAHPKPFLKGWHARRRLELTLTESYRELQSAIATAAGCALDQLAGAWPNEKEKPRRAAGQEPENETSLRACERFVCLVYVSFLLVVLVRMRTLILAAGGMYVFVLLAMTSYPFQPRASIVAVLAILLLTVLGVVTLVFAQAHRNVILSNLTNTKPGELGADFWVRLTSFAALPVVTFFASQFPQLNRLLSSWLEPALQALNK